jgi:outer membrane cobalamin receptor
MRSEAIKNRGKRLRGSMRRCAREWFHGLFLAGSLGCAFPAANAQQAADAQYNEVVISASVLPLTEANLNQHVSVFTRQDIERDAPASVADFLVRRAGMAVDRSARSGAYGALFLRGADPSHVVVLIDGIRQNDPLSSRGSAVDLNTLTLDDVERIEVVRGNATVVHAEALAGVIQIFTRRRGDAQAQRADAGIEAGEQGLRAAHAVIGRGSWYAAISRREDGDADDIGSTRVRSGNIGFRDRRGASNWQMQLRVSASDNSAFPDDSGGVAYAVNRRHEKRHTETRQLAAALDHDFGHVGALAFQLARFERDGTQDTPRVFPGVRDPFGLPAIMSDSAYRRNEVQAIWRSARGAAWDTSLGIAHRQETGSLDSRIFLGRWTPADFIIRRITNSIAAEARKNFGQWSLQLGLRYEQTPGQESQRHPAFGLQYALPGDGGRIGMALSSASKLPSFYALGHPFVGNPELKPERSRQAELYYASPETSPWQMRLTLFGARYRDLVDFEAGPPPRLINRASIESAGIEFSLRHTWRPGWRIRMQGTLMDLRTPDGGEPLRGRPARQFGIGLEGVAPPRWTWQAGLDYIGPRYDSSIPTGGRWLGGYPALNASIDWRANETQLYAALDNVLNRRAEETIGTPIAERRLRAGLRRRW